MRCHLETKSKVRPKKKRPGRAVNSFIDQGLFVAMKTLSGRKTPRCDKRQFR